MSAAAGGCGAFVFVGVANLILFAQVVALWLTYAWIHMSGHDDWLIGAAAGLGALGWWTRFRRIEPALKRFATRRFGPGPDIVHPFGIGSGFVWAYFASGHTGWRMVIWTFVVVAPIVQALMRSHS